MSLATVAKSKIQLGVSWNIPSKLNNEKQQQREDFAAATYKQTKALNTALLDSFIEGHERTTTLFFGRIVSNPDDLPSFPDPLGYSMTYNQMKKNNGNALHRHNSVEIFVALDQPFEIRYGSKGEFSTVIKPWDIIACPAEAIHSYKNIGEDGGQILTFLCGKPSIKWADGVVEEARKNGAFCDDSGILLNPDEENLNTTSNKDAIKMLQGEDKPELFLKDGDIDNLIFRFENKDKRSLLVGSQEGTLSINWHEIDADTTFIPEGDQDTLIVVLKGSVFCSGTEYIEYDVLKQPYLMKSGRNGVTILMARSKLPHNLDFFFDAE